MLTKVLILSLVSTVVLPVLVPNQFAPQASAVSGTMFDYRSSFRHWTTWVPGNSSLNSYSGANHVPYQGESGSELVSQSSQTNLTTENGSQTGYLWDTREYSYANDFSVSAQIYVGRRDGADGLSFTMKPRSGWPNGGTTNGSGANHSRGGNSQIRVDIDTFQNGSEIANDKVVIYSRNSSGVETKYGGVGGNGAPLKLLRSGVCTEVADVEDNTYNYFTFQWSASARTLRVFGGQEGNCLIWEQVISSSEQDATTFTWGFQAETGGANNYQSVGDVRYSFRNQPTATDLDTSLTFSDTSSHAFAPTDGEKSIYDLTSPFTVEAWVRPSSTCNASLCNIIAKEYSFLLGIQNGQVHYISGKGTAAAGWNGGWTNAGGNVPANSWSHVAATYSGTTITIFQNGQQIFQSTMTAPSDSVEYFNVGARATVAAPNNRFERFTGQIDEVRIWSTARSASTIASGMHARPTLSDSNLKAYFDFNEGTGSEVINRAQNSLPQNDLEVYGTPSWIDIKTVSTSGPHSVATFPRSYINSVGGWRAPVGVSSVSALVVAGGGGGGAESDDTGWFGGGGGGGGYRFVTQTGLSQTPVSVVVGAGGRAGQQVSSATAVSLPTNGQDSMFHTLTSVGGGAGGVSFTSGLINGSVGGSGGGGATYSGTGALGTSEQGNRGGAAAASCCAGGGGGGFGSAGGTGTAATVNGAQGGAAGNGVLNPLYIVGTSPQYLAAGGAAGSTGTVGSTGSLGGTAAFTDATANTGSGGGGGGSHSSFLDKAGGYGGSGIIIIRWITATAPIFTGPAFDTLTAGMVETFTVSGSPNSPLTRGYRWQVSTDTGTTWANATTGSGLTSASYITPTLETTTSGIRYQYRVIVTDSDTAGLSITESATVYLVVNPRITITGSSVSLSQKYGETQTVTYTIANGTGTRTTAASPNNRTGITWSSVSGNAATLAIGAGLSFGTYYETLTVTDSVTATTTQMFTISISKADTITVTATPSTTTYNASAITPGYVVSGLKNSETATATSNFLGISGTSYGTTTTPPTNAGSYRFTPSDVVLSVGASLNNYQGVTYESATVTINKAFQAKLSIGQYDAFPGISSYPINVYGGTGLGNVTRTLVETGTANCTLSGTLILTAANVGTCTVRAVKDGGVNYFNETTTATIYWITFINRYTPSGPTVPTDLGLSGSTGFEKRTYETFTVLSFANGSGTAVTSAAKNTVMRIIGTGFNSSDETTEVIIGFFSIPKSSLTFNTTNPLANYVEFTLPNSSDLDAGANDVAMKSRKGWAFAPGLLNVTG